MPILQIKTFQLAANILGPANAEKLVLLLPGRLDTKDYAHFVSHQKYLSDRGYLTVAFDPPGTWESPGDISLYTTTNYLKAINELIDHFGKRPTILLGHSRGGSMAMLAGPANSAVTHIITIMSSVQPSYLNKKSVVDNVYVTSRDLPPNDREHRREFRLPLNYFADASQYDILPELKKCQKPKLFFYGTEDDLVEAEEVREIYEAVPEPKKIHQLKTEHDYRYHDDIIKEANGVIGEFLGV